MTSPGAAERDVSIADVIESIRRLTRMLWSGRGLVIRPVVIAVAVGLVVALGSREEFTAGIRLLPYKTGATGGAGSLSSLAGLAGLRLPTNLAGETISADLYPVIAKTLDFRISVAETPIRFSPEAAPATTVAYLQGHPTLTERLSDILGSLRSVFASPSAGLAAAAGDSSLRFYSRRYLRTIQDVDERLSVTMDRKTSVIAIQAVMPTRWGAANLVQVASNSLMHRIIDYEAKKAGEQLAFVEEQYGQSRARFEVAQRKLAEFTDRNRILNSAVANIERDRLQREFDVEYAVLQQLSSEREQARIRKSQDTPVFTVIENVVVPINRSAPRRTFLVLLSLAVGLAAGVVRILISNYVPVRN